MNRHIIFDFDGTIVNSLPLAVKLYNQMAKKYKLRNLQESDISKLDKLSIAERMKLFDVPLYILPKLALEFKRDYRKFTATLPEIIGIRELIMKLQELGYSLHIISSNAADNIKQFLSHANMEVFDNVYSSKALLGKQTALNSVAKKLRIRKEQMIYIGDELRDIESCKKAGVEIIAVTWGFDDLELLTAGNPDYIAHKPEEILTIISQLQNQRSE